jgi:hypothetical protein
VNDLKSKHPNFTGNWNDLEHFELLTKSPIRTPEREIALRSWEGYKLERQRAAATVGGKRLKKNTWWPKLRTIDLTGATFDRIRVGYVDLRGAILDHCSLRDACLKGANLENASLRHADFSALSSGAILDFAFMHDADLTGAICEGVDFSSASLSRANFSGARLGKANLEHANLVETIFTDADLVGCHIYGISAWGLTLSEGTKQQNLVVTPSGESEITTDDIEVAQFLYLLINNKKIRKVIDTITSKVVLILGRFTEERKLILDAIRGELRKRDFLPVIFDFSIPANRDVTETVKLLAGLARFVIADITDATEVRVELHTVVRDFTSLPVQPILLRGHPPFVSMSSLKSFPWLLPSFEYETQKHLLANLDKSVVGPAEANVLELRGQPFKRP